MFLKTFIRRCAGRALVLAVAFSLFESSQAISSEPTIDKQGRLLEVKPSEADPSVRQWDTASQIYYDPARKAGKVLLWLTGTGGTPEHGPDDFFNLALARGYRLISLSFISTPAVAQVCR